jgi:hypothetical protein
MLSGAFTLLAIAGMSIDALAVTRPPSTLGDQSIHVTKDVNGCLVPSVKSMVLNPGDKVTIINDVGTLGDGNSISANFNNPQGAAVTSQTIPDKTTGATITNGTGVNFIAQINYTNNKSSAATTVACVATTQNVPGMGAAGGFGLAVLLAGSSLWFLLRRGRTATV